MNTLKQHSRPLLWALCLATGLLLSLWWSAARADDDDDEGHGGERPRAVQMLPAYVQECGACHVPFAPRMLPAASWQRLMKNLPHHFGTDASLEPAEFKQISAWLQQHAGPGGATTAPPEDRITRTRWFMHEHDELPASVWKRASIQKPSNCAACHRQAEQGDYRERFIRVPR